MAKNKLPKGALKKAWAEAKKKNIPQKQRAKWAMKRAWANSGGKSSKGRVGSSNKTMSKKGSTGSTGGTRKVGKGGFNISKIFKLMRLGALALPAATTLMNSALPIEQKLHYIKSDYFGMNAQGGFELSRLAKGWTPFVAATLLTYGIPKLTGLIRSF